MSQDNPHHLHIELQEDRLRKCPQCESIFTAIAFCPNDGTKLEDHAGASEHASLFAEKYQILDELGKGGMGTVFRVRQVMLDKILALKIIPSHYLNEQLTARFQREAKTMAALDHPHLARIVDFGVWLNQPFMAMEYVDGATLSTLISERVLPPAQAIELFCQVLDGLQHAHSEGVLHRDIKPSNIMVRNEEGSNKAILLDFGIAKRMEAQDGNLNTQALTRTGEMIGSPLYMSPEQARGEKLTERSDLYSLGCALFEALTGTPPFVGKTAMETFFLHIEQNPPSLKEASLGREFHPGLERVVRRLLSKAPGDRYASAMELKHALASCLDCADSEKNIQKSPAKALPLLPLASITLAALAVSLVISALVHQSSENAKISSKNSKVAVTGTMINDLPDNFAEQALQQADPLNPLDTQPQKARRKISGTDSALMFTTTDLSDQLVDLVINDKNLTKLAISHSRFPISMLGKLPPSLNYLELNGAGLLPEDCKLIATNANLKTLVLRYNTFNSRAFRNLLPLTNLQVLDLNQTHIDARDLTILKPMKSLRALILSDNDAIDDGALRYITTLKQIEWLDISNTRVTEAGLAELLKLPNLNRLSLKKLLLKDSDLRSLKNFSNLRILSLAGNSITAQGLKFLPAFKKLEELDISENDIDDRGVDQLIRYKNLRSLHISKNKISKSAVLKLAALPNLTELFCRRISFSEEEALDFFKRCPTCQSIHSARNYDVFQRSEFFPKH